jgi:hypothetical protein
MLTNAGKLGVICLKDKSKSILSKHREEDLPGFTCGTIICK